MATCPWDRGLDVAVVGEALYVGASRIPLTETPEFLTWLTSIITGEVES